MSVTVDLAALDRFRARLGVPDTADGITVLSAAIGAIDDGRARQLASARAQLATMRAEQLERDPAFQQKLAATRIDAVTSSDLYGRWAEGRPDPSPDAQVLDDVRGSAAYKNWAL